MRKHSTKPFRFVLHKIMIPIAVIASSAVILSVSYWYHEQELSKQLLNGQAYTSLGQLPTGLDSQGIGNNGVSAPTDTAIGQPQRIPLKSKTSKQRDARSGKTTSRHATSDSSKQNHSITTRVHSGTSTAKNGHNVAKAKRTTTPVVSGGIVKQMMTGQVPDTTVQSHVVQYGNRPQTTGIAGSLQSTWGSKLTIPSDIPSNRLLAVSLQSGILWSVVPPSQIQQNGQLGPADASTMLMYTPFPGNGTARLTSSVVQVGQVMPAATLNDTTFGIRWSSDNATSVPSAVVTSNITNTPTHSTVARDTTQTATRANTATSHTVNVTNSNTSTNASNAIDSISNKTSNSSVTPGVTTNGQPTANVYLSSLYADAYGSVIVVHVVKPSGAEKSVVYQFNEATHSVKRLAELPNDGRDYSWLGVASHHIYWGIRKVNPSNPSAFTEQQYMYTMPTDVKKRISLGTWTSTVYVNGERLIFQVRSTPTWKEFVPPSAVGSPIMEKNRISSSVSPPQNNSTTKQNAKTAPQHASQTSNDASGSQNATSSTTHS